MFLNAEALFVKTRVAYGQLLLSGEYLIMDGAVGLALPLCYQQNFTVRPWVEKTFDRFDFPKIVWQQFYDNRLLFEAIYDANSLECLSSNDMAKAQFLQKIFVTIQKLQPGFWSIRHGVYVRTDQNFSPAWGLGSSATLVYHLAQWVQIDPLRLWHILFDGSGYDIACTKMQRPILYKNCPQKGIVYTAVSFHPTFSDHLFFVYTGHKVSSEKAVQQFRKKNYGSKDIQYISNLTQAMLVCDVLSDFEILMQKHEARMEKILCKPCIGRLFTDYPGALKSLGAWGGDFFLATGDCVVEVKDYFQRRGYSIVKRFDEMVKQ